MRITYGHGIEIAGACALFVGELTISISNVFPGGEVAVFHGPKLVKSYPSYSADNVAKAITFAKRRIKRQGARS